MFFKNSKPLWKHVFTNTLGGYMNNNYKIVRKNL